MARPKGTKAIKTPAEMMVLFTAYKNEVKSKPFKVPDWVGGMGKKVQRLKEKPLTMVGFENYCYYKGLTVAHYFDNYEGRYEDFCTICSRIRGIIKQDQIEGGMAGIYNPSITQRLNGLTEKIEQTNIEQPLF